MPADIFGKRDTGTSPGKKRPKHARPSIDPSHLASGNNKSLGSMGTGTLISMYLVNVG